MASVGDTSKSEKQEKEEKQEFQDIRSSDVSTKYHVASRIANSALEKLINIIKNNEIPECDSYLSAGESKQKDKEVPENQNNKQDQKDLIVNDSADKDTLDINLLCCLSDNYILQETSKVYNTKVKGEKLEKGIAFPTCISLNEVCAHFSPLPADSKKVKKGDVVKITLGVHIDGFISVVGHTMIAMQNKNEVDMKNEKEEKRKGDVIKAAWYAGEVALKAIKPGNKNTYVTQLINKTIKQFKCNPVIGFCSHQMKRFVIDGNLRISNSETAEERAEEFTFNLYETYGVDIIVSTGDGKAKESDMRTTVYKRAVETNYNLKTHLSRSFFHMINKKYPTLPFSVRNLEDERSWRIGIPECMRHELLHPYCVLTEKMGEYVAEIKFTVIITPTKTKKISGVAFDIQNLKSNYELEDEELKKLIDIKTSSKKKKGSNAKKTKEDEEKAGAS